MMPRIKGISLLLAVIVVFSALFCGSASILSPNAAEYLPPTPEAAPAPTPSEPLSPPAVSLSSPEIRKTPIPAERPLEPSPIAPQTNTAPLDPVSTTDITIGSYVSGISAQKAFVYDCHSKQFLYMKSQADARVYPASITKLMNVYTALQYLSPETMLTMQDDISALVFADSSKAELRTGDCLSMEMAIRGTLIASGSDAAHLIAVSAGRLIAGNDTMDAQEAENVFVETMNRQAVSMGLINTHFVNCDGYPDPDHYSCMADLAILATRCLDVELIRETVRCAYARLTFADGRSKNLSSTNWLLKSYTGYYRPQAVGMKTGTSDAAGACLLSAFKVNDRHLLVGIFQCYSHEGRFANAVKLFDTYKNTPVTDPEYLPNA